MTTSSRTARRAAPITAGLMMAACLVPASVASENDHGAHRHGVSKLDLVVAGKKLEMELESPGADIVGFEHAPATDADRDAIRRAGTLLKDGMRLFSLPAAARCVLESSRVETPDTGAHQDGRAGHHEEKEHAHGHDEKKPTHGHEKPGGETHAEFHAHYRFACERPERLTHIDVTFFRSFPGAKEIEVRAVTPDRQIRRELTAGSARLTL